MSSQNFAHKAEGGQGHELGGQELLLLLELELGAAIALRGEARRSNSSALAAG